jgi:peptidoglycan/xylan/chitin deacetylase (PgdA/CDA1 family)
MKEVLVRLICHLLNWSGLPWLIREVYARRKITIINYHDPKPDVFEEHAEFYIRNYSFVSIDMVVTALTERNVSKLPPKPLLLTFDDGYAGNVHLIDILKRYRIPAVIYAVAGMINTQRHFWFDKLPHQGQSMLTLKRVSDSERRLRMRVDYNHWDEKEYNRPVALSREELNAFLDSGGSVASHTVFHPLLDNCQEEVGFYECRMSKDLLETLLGRPVVHFALPNGNFNERVLDWVRRAGYVTCRTTSPGWVTPKTSPFLLPVFGIADTADSEKAAVQACGLWSIFKLFQSCFNLHR